MGNLIKPEYFKMWRSVLDLDIQEKFSAIEQIKSEPHSFTFYTSVSVMSSSKIEGEQMEVDSYVKHKMLHVEYLPEMTEKPDDLYNAYLYAKENKPDQNNFLQVHKLIAAHLLPQDQRGSVRKTEMLILEHNTGGIQYKAASLSIVKDSYSALWNELRSC